MTDSQVFLYLEALGESDRARCEACGTIGLCYLFPCSDQGHSDDHLPMLAAYYCPECTIAYYSLWRFLLQI